jgi:DNA-binding beta-propeller fold protein YncE
VGVSGNVTLKHPVAVAVGDDGQIYVADNSHGAILVFDASERFSRAIGHEKFKPAGVAVFGNRVYATDMTSQSVEAFDTATGQRLAAFGTVGDGDGQFRLPLGVATDSKGDVYVADMMRCRVQKFSPDGKFLMGFGEMGDFAGAFVRPKHLAVDSDGVIYVVDAGFQNVQMFNASGKLLMHFGAAGGHPGSMYLPAGIAVSDDAPDMVEGLTHPGFKTKRTIVVTNQFGLNRVALYAMGGLREGFTAADLAKSATAISTGVAVPTAEQLKFSNPGTETPIDPDAIKARSAPSGAAAPTGQGNSPTPK